MRTGKVRSCLAEWFDDSDSSVAVCPTLAPIPHLIVRISLIITSCRKPPLHDLAAAVNRPAAVAGSEQDTPRYSLSLTTALQGSTEPSSGPLQYCSGVCSEWRAVTCREQAFVNKCVGILGQHRSQHIMDPTLTLITKRKASVCTRVRSTGELFCMEHSAWAGCTRFRCFCLPGRIMQCVGSTGVCGEGSSRKQGIIFSSR